MIIEDAINREENRHGYARILVGMVHAWEAEVFRTNRLEEATTGHTRVSVLWDSYEMGELSQHLTGKGYGDDFDKPLSDAWDRLYPGLIEKYDSPYGDYNVPLDPTQTTLFLIQGSRDDLEAMFTNLVMGVSDLPSGDDSTFDYWPSEFGAAVHVAHDLNKITPDVDHLEPLRKVWDRFNAEWELDTPSDLGEAVTPRP